MHFVEEMTFREKIVGPWGPTEGSPLGARLAWSIPEAELSGPRIAARLAMPCADWIRLGPDGIRRQDQRLTFITDDDAVVLMHYDNALIRESAEFLSGLAAGTATSFDDQHMRIVAQFDTGDARYSWLTQSLFLGEGRLAGDHEIEYRIHRLV